MLILNPLFYTHLQMLMLRVKKGSGDGENLEEEEAGEGGTLLPG